LPVFVVNSNKKIEAENGTSMTKLLITGATGFIGRHLLAALDGSDFEVHAIVRPSSKPLHLPPSQIHLYTGHIQELLTILANVKPDMVIHLGAHLAAEQSTDNIDDFLNANIGFGTHLLEAMRQCRISRILNIGTYYQQGTLRPTRPVNLYAATKQAFSTLLDFYGANYDISILTLILGHVYGPNESETKIISSLIQAILTGKTIPLSSGEQWLPLIHVNDIVSGVLTGINHLADQPLRISQEYTLAPPQSWQLRTIVPLLEQLLNKPAFIEWGARPLEPNAFLEPWEPGPVCPDWQPALDLRSGLQNCIDHFSIRHEKEFL
jgi:nucleoside-diphosphate-sugar epimerase